MSKPSLLKNISCTIHSRANEYKVCSNLSQGHYSESEPNNETRDRTCLLRCCSLVRAQLGYFTGRWPTYCTRNIVVPKQMLII